MRVGLLRAKTLRKRAAGVKVVAFGVNDKMVLASISLKKLLSLIQTKVALTKYLGDALLSEYADNDNLAITVIYHTSVQSSRNVCEERKTHSHEEADTLIPLHVLRSIKDLTAKLIDVSSPDSDVLHRSLIWCQPSLRPLCFFSLF